MSQYDGKVEINVNQASNNIKPHMCVYIWI